jgi:hypothetical protein
MFHHWEGVKHAGYEDLARRMKHRPAISTRMTLLEHGLREQRMPMRLLAPWERVR